MLEGGNRGGWSRVGSMVGSVESSVSYNGSNEDEGDLEEE